MKNRRRNNDVDALELLRRAVERSPENDEYKLDLAELLSEMGCLSQSNRLLLDMLGGGGPSECYYGLALNLLSASDIPGARRTLWRYCGADPLGAQERDVRRIHDEMNFYESFLRPAGRRARRAACLADLACERMKEEKFDRAVRLFEKSLAIEPERDEIRALYATALEFCGRHRAARQEMRAATEKETSVRALCIAAQFYHMRGMPRKSRQMAERAVQERPVDVEAPHAHPHIGRTWHGPRGWRMRPPGHAADALRPRTSACARRGAPAGRRQGGGRGEILGTHRAHRPGRRRRRYYIRAAADGTLRGQMPEYVYQVPQKRSLRAPEVRFGTLSQHCGDLETPWREDGKFRALLKWCLTVNNPQFRRAAVTALAALEDAEAEATLREVLTRPEISYDMKFNALMLLRLRGVDLSRALPPSIDAQDGLLPDADALLPNLPIGLRQACRYAVEVLEDDYGLSPASAVALIALRARARRRLEPCLRRRIPAYAAALAYCYLSMRGGKALVPPALPPVWLRFPHHGVLRDAHRGCA